MDERIIQFRVGVMVIATMIIFAILLLLFGDLPSLVKGTYDLKFALNEAPGVQSDTPVRVNGVLIGRVRSVGLDENGHPDVHARIEQKYVLYRDQAARVSGSLLGDAVIEIVGGDRSQPHTPLQNGDVMIGIVAKDPLQAIANLESNVSVAIESIAKTSDQVGQLAQRANRIIDQNEPHINGIIANAEQVLARTRATVDNLDKIVGDPELQANLRQAVAGLPRVINELSTTIAGVKSTMQLADQNLENLQGLTKPLGERGPRLVENIDRSLNQLDGLMGELSGFTRNLTNSEGTIARLVKDPQMYEQISQAVTNINQLTQDLSHDIRPILREIRPIVNDVRVLTDKAARHPEQFGVRGLIQQNSGIK